MTFRTLGMVAAVAGAAPREKDTYFQEVRVMSDNRERAREIVDDKLPVTLTTFEAIDIVESALDAAYERGRAGEWRPIEDAPRDGTKILFWYEGSEYEERGYKVGEMRHYLGQWFPLIGCTVYSTRYDKFTAWQPIPAPPAGEPSLK